MSAGRRVSGWFLRNISTRDCARCSLRWCRTSLDGAVVSSPVVAAVAAAAVAPEGISSVLLVGLCTNGLLSSGR